MEFAETKDSLIFEKPFFNRMISEVVAIATKTAVAQTRIELTKEVELSTTEASKLLNVSKNTIIKYCLEGHRKAGVLNHKKEGKKFIINKYQLEEFKKNM